MLDSTLSAWVTNDGQHLAIQDWKLAPGVPVRSLVLVVHGLGEYAGMPGSLPRDAHVAALRRWLDPRF